MNWKALLACFLPVLLFAAEPWSKDSHSWTAQDAERILQDSPWAGPTTVQFTNAEDDSRPDQGPLPGAAQAGMAGPRGVSDGHWDGGVTDWQQICGLKRQSDSYQSRRAKPRAAATYDYPIYKPGMAGSSLPAEGAVPEPLPAHAE